MSSEFNLLGNSSDSEYSYTRVCVRRWVSLELNMGSWLLIYTLDVLTTWRKENQDRRDTQYLFHKSITKVMVMEYSFSYLLCASREAGWRWQQHKKTPQYLSSCCSFMLPHKYDLKTVSATAMVLGVIGWCRFKNTHTPRVWALLGSQQNAAWLGHTLTKQMQKPYWWNSGGFAQLITILKKRKSPATETCSFFLPWGFFSPSLDISFH